MGRITMTPTQQLQKRLVKNIIFKWTIGFFSTLLMVPLVLILWHIVSHGIAIFSVDFFMNLPKPVGVTGGGVSNAIIGTLILILIASIISIPIALLIGVYLAENKDTKLATVTRLCIDTLQGIPSIVLGIIAYAWIVVPMGTFSALSGGIALAFMMLPIITKSTEETLKLIPHSLKEASYALGTPYYKTIFKVIIPTGLSGIMSGIIIGISRIAGETAPLLFTAFGNPFMNLNINKAINSLPLLIFTYATSPYQDWQQLAWGASLLLVLLVLGLSITAKVISHR